MGRLSLHSQPDVGERLQLGRICDLIINRYRLLQLRNDGLKNNDRGGQLSPLLGRPFTLAQGMDRAGHSEDESNARSK